MRRTRFPDLDLLDCRCDPCSGSRGRPEIGGSVGEHVGVLACHTPAQRQLQRALFGESPTDTMRRERP